jgi:hypothetical protein
MKWLLLLLVGTAELVLLKLVRQVVFVLEEPTAATPHTPPTA